MDTKSRALPMARVNTRIRPDQQKYIKMLAKKTNSTEGEIFRAVIDEYKNTCQTYLYK